MILLWNYEKTARASGELGSMSYNDVFGDYYPGREALGVGAYMGFISGENAAKYAAK